MADQEDPGVEVAPSQDPWAGFDMKDPPKDPWAEFDMKPTRKNTRSDGGILGEVKKAATPDALKDLRETAPRLMTKGLTAYQQEILGMEPGVDYDTGASHADKWNVERADSPEEAKLALQKTYGSGNVRQDKHGRWIVKKDGKDTELFGQGGTGLLHEGSRTIAQMEAAAPETIGALGGGILGGMVGGPLGMAGGSALGAMAGKGIDEGVKSFQGFNLKSGEEELNSLATTGGVNAAMSAAGPIAKGIGRPIARGIRSWGGVTPETAEMASTLLKEGARPPIISVAPGFKSLIDKQKKSNIAIGDPEEGRKVAYLGERMDDIMKSSNYPKPLRDQIMKQVTSPMEALSEAEVGREMVPAMQQHLGMLEKNAAATLDKAKAVADSNHKLFDVLAKRPIGDFADTISTEIKTGRKDLGRTFEPAYALVDNMAGAPIIPTAFVKQQARALTQNMRPESIPAIFREIDNMDEMVMPSQMHRLRSTLRAEADSGNLTPDLKSYDYNELARAADISFTRTGREGPTNKRAIDFMRKVDNQYGEQISFYNDQRVNTLARQTEANMSPDPEVIAGLIGEVGYTDRLSQIVKKLSPDAKRDLASADMRMMLQDSERRSAALGFESDGNALNAIVNERGKLIDEIYKPVYGEKFVERFKEHAKELAALNGKVSLAQLEQRTQGLGPGAMLDALSERVTALKAQESFVKDNFMMALTSNNPAVKDTAFSIAVQPGGDERLKAVEAALGFNHPAMEAVRQYALKDMLKRSVYERPSRLRAMEGKEIEDAFSKYSPTQKEILFPGPMREDVGTLAKHAQFLFPPEMEDVGTSLAAKSITQNVGFNVLNPKTLYADTKWVNAWLTGKVLASKPLLHFLAGTLREDPKAGRQLLRAVGRGYMTAKIETGEGEEMLDPKQAVK